MIMKSSVKNTYFTQPALFLYIPVNISQFNDGDRFSEGNPGNPSFEGKELIPCYTTKTTKKNQLPSLWSRNDPALVQAAQRFDVVLRNLLIVFAEK